MGNQAGGRAMTQYKRVAVLLGGLSAERDVSLSSGAGCAKALREEGFDVTEIDPRTDDLAAQLHTVKPDCVFNALHGRWGEDGCVQGLLELMRIPYTHSGVLASALAMHKQRTKDVYRAAGLPIVKSIVVDRREAAARHLMEPPYVVKPVHEGSSVGVFIIRKGDNRPPAELAREDKELSERAHMALGCRGVSRTDLRFDDTGAKPRLVLLETNTQPGMTPTSLVPEQAAYAGLSYRKLCRWIVEDASCDR